MNHKYLSGAKSLIVLAICLIFSSSSFAQKNSEIWEALLKNDRAKALELVNKTDFNTDIENALLKKIIEMENGRMMVDHDFVAGFSKFPEYENYLFSHWMSPYFFGNYLEDGFSTMSYKTPHLIDASKLSNSTVRSGLYYLQAISNRHLRKWGEYKSLMEKIDVVAEWEFCGVFENLNSSGIKMRQEPESQASNEVLFDAQSKGEAQWYSPDKGDEVYNFFTNHSEYGSGVHYAQTFIVSPKEQRVHLKFGKGGQVRLWLNDVLILEDDDKYITELDAYTYAVNLQKGVNKILVKSAIVKGSPYFILRLEDTLGKPLSNIKTSFVDRKYKKGSPESVKPEIIPNSIELFFQFKLKDLKSDVNLTKFSLYATYYRNGHLEKALQLLKDWSRDYPESSFLKACLAQCYLKTGEEGARKELQENLKRLDPDYYLSAMLKFESIDALLKLDLDEFTTEVRKIGEVVDYSYIKKSTEFFIASRQQNRSALRQHLDGLVNDETLPSIAKSTFAELYSSILNDDSATTAVLENYNATEYDWSIIQYLAYYYEKQNRVEEAIQLYEDSLKKYGGDNNVHYKLIKLLHSIGQYERSLPIIEMAIKNYPNSYLFTKYKGDAYAQLDKRDEAADLYELTLSRKPSWHELRGLINDLRGKKNPLNEFHLTKAYNYIKENRGVIEQNNYGLNTLLSQKDILVYKNGGGVFKITLIHEITAQNGIELFKEHSMGLTGDYVIHKSEAVKVDGSIVPADKNGSDLVFDGLEVGDVIYLDYESRFSRNGRFYKDYILGHNFTGYHPVIKNVYRLLTYDKKVNFQVSNGKVPYKTFKKGDLYVHEWSLNNTKGLPIQEDYMPPYNDVSTRLHISSIDSWNDIAKWYSDIVDQELRFDPTVLETFRSIFPEGHEKLSELERAKRIYYYITNSLSYSHVSFRQSGFVPQRPSKTIKTKLGDCKDFSSLFLVLAKHADLDTKLVLVLTSDYGKNRLILPSSDFNHCIVKVQLNDKEQFLELTDKFLPFGSIPISLRDATILEIPNSGKMVNDIRLMHLENVRSEPAVFKSDYELEVNGDNSSASLSNSLSGSVASYYIDKFKTQKNELLEETILQEISNSSNKSIKTMEIKSFEHDQDEGKLDFWTDLVMDLNESKVGDLNAFEIPFFLIPYDNSVIQDDSRSYPIEYKNYENTDVYKESMLIKLSKGQEFVDIPKAKTYQYKKHQFSISYALESKSELKIKTVAKVTTDQILPSEYAKFKEYVEKVLNARQALIKYKS